VVWSKWLFIPVRVNVVWYIREVKKKEARLHVSENHYSFPFFTFSLSLYLSIYHQTEMREYPIDFSL